jgi:chromosome segregation ATPase
LQLSLTTLSHGLADVSDQRRAAEAARQELADRSAAATRLEEQLAEQRLEFERAQQELARAHDEWSAQSDSANRGLVAARQQLDADRQQLETDRQRFAAEQSELAQSSQHLADREEAFELTERERSLSRDAWVAEVDSERRQLEADRLQIGAERDELATDRKQLEATRQQVDVEWQRIAQAVADGASREQELDSRRQAAEQAERDLARLREEWSNEASSTQDDIESRRQGFADASQRLTARQLELDQLQAELNERERLAAEQKIQSSEIARAVETRLAELTTRQLDLDIREAEFARKSEQLTVREQNLRRIERELDARKDDCQQGFDVERQAVSSRAVELTAQQQRLESRRQEVESLEQALQERESSLRCEIEAERRGLERDRQEIDEKRQAAASIPDRVQHDHEVVQRQAEELVRRQTECRKEEEALQALVKLLDEQRIQIDRDTEAVQLEHARLREELTRLEAERQSLHTEQQRLWAERERLESTVPQQTKERESLTAERERLDAEVSRLNAEREAFAAERTTFEGEVQAWAEVFYESQQLQVQPTEVPPEAETQPIASIAKTDAGCSPPACDVDTTPGPSFDSLSENDGWMLDELLGVGLGGATRPPSDDAGVTVDDKQEAQSRGEIVVDQVPAETKNDTNTADVTQDAQVLSPGDDNMHSYIHDLLARLRSDSEAPAPPDLQQEWTGTASASGLVSLDDVPERGSESALVPEAATSDMEARILADIDDLGQSVRKSVEQVARPRQHPNEIRLGIGTLRELANYSARSAIAQHSWKKTKSELGMKASYVAGALTVAAGMDYMLADSPKWSKLSFLPLGIALFMAGDLALSYFRARRAMAIAENIPAAEAWQTDNAAIKSTDTVAETTTPKSPMYTFEYANEKNAAVGSEE